MKAVIYRGPRRVAVEEIPVPEGSGALVSVEACGICGTDLTIFAGKHPRSKPPLVLGHEFVGTLLENTGTANLTRGTRVVCYPLISCGHCDACGNGREHVCETLRLVGIDSAGGMAGFARVDPQLLYPIADNVTAEVAAQVEPLAVCVHAANVGQIMEGQKVAIIGAGPIGVTLAMLLRQYGVERIVLSDVSHERLEIAGALGFETAVAGSDLSWMLGDAPRRGFDVVFECAGAAAAVSDAVSHARNGGKVVIVSIHKAPQPVDLQAMSFRELSISGTRVYTRAEFQEAINLLPQMHADLARLVSRKIKMSEAQEAMAGLTSGATELKVIVDCLP